MAATRTILAVGALLLAVAGPAAAADVALTAAVDRTELTIRDRIILTLTLEGSQEARPELPSLPDFDVRSLGTSTSMQVVNGRMSVSTTNRYVLLPKREGIFTIGAATAVVGGQRVTSEPLVVKVLPAAAVPAAPTPSATAPRAPGKPAGASKDVFITARLSKKQAVVGEQLVYTFRFFTRVRTGQLRLDPSAFDGFVAEELGEQRQYETTINGQRYQVVELRQALFPQEAGTFTIPPATLTVDVAVQDQRRRRRRGFFDSPFDDFFGRRMETRILRTSPLTVTVEELPPAPAAFSGLVGRFKVTGELSKQELHVGESTTLTVTVRGTGNVQAIPEPKLPGLESFKVYADKPVSWKSGKGSAITGSRTFKKALVPLREGEVVLPGARLTYFDPGKREYVVSRAGPFRLTVLPPTGEEELKLTELLHPGSGQVAVKLLGQDLLPLHRGLIGLEPQGAGPAMLALGGAGLGLPPLLFFGLVLVRQRRDRLDRDVALRRRRGALAGVRRQRKALRAAIRQGREREAVELAARLLREYLGDMLNLGGTALTAREAAERLQEAGLAEARAKEVAELLGELEAALYGAGDRSGTELGELDRRLGQLLRHLERELGKVVRG